MSALLTLPAKRSDCGADLPNTGANSAELSERGDSVSSKRPACAVPAENSFNHLNC